MKRARKSKSDTAPRHRFARGRRVKRGLAREEDREVQVSTEGGIHMRVPGFTATAALYDRPAPYRTGESVGSTPGEAQVVPQACTSIGPCRVCVTWRIIPPRVCLSLSCLGFGRSFCVP